MKTKTKLLLALCAIVLLAGCADSNTLTGHVRDGLTAPAGFWRGLWHGICAPFSLVGIMFGMDIGIYEPFNNGNWYNFGFLIGVGSCWGSSHASRRKKS